MNVKVNVTGAVAALAVAGTLLTGCSGAAEVERPATVSKTKLQAMAKDKLQTAAKKKAKSVACDDGIQAKVGATQHCVLTATDGKKWAVTATVTAVKDGNNASIDFKVDKNPVA